MSGNHGKLKTRRSKKNVLGPGQGARKGKVTHSRTGSGKHRRSLKGKPL